MIEQFMSSPFFIPALAVFSFVAGVIAFQALAKKDKEGIEEEGLEEIVKGDVEEMVEMWGIDVKKTLSYSIFPNGMIDKAYHYNEYRSEWKDDDGETKVDVNEDFFYFKIRPESKIDRIIAKFTDDVLDFDKYTNYIVVEQDAVSDGEMITIDDSWNPTKMANVWVPDNQNGYSFVRDKTIEEMFELILETSKESVRAINGLNLQFVSKMEELEKLQELQSGNLKDQLEDYMEGN